MKPLLTFVAICISINMTFGQNFKSEQEFKNYLISNHENLDPIEGIYTVSVYITRYAEGEYRGNITRENELSLAIIKKNGELKAYSLDGKPRQSITFKSTAVAGVYGFQSFNEKLNIRYKANAILTDGKLLEYGYEAKDQELRDYFIEWMKEDGIKPTARQLDYLVEASKIKYEFKWLKTFPSEQDLRGIEKPVNELSVVKATGVAISSNGFIATNYHVVENAGTISVTGINGDFSRKFLVKTILTDARNDLAILRIIDPRFNTLGSLPYTIREETANVGEDVFVLGYPMTSTMGSEIKLTDGIISSKTGFKGDVSSYQISAPIQSGNSGGPLFDKDGNLIGIINAKHLEAENVSYAIKIKYLNSLIELLPEKLTFSNTNVLRGKSLSDQSKVISKYIYLITVNDPEVDNQNLITENFQNSPEGTNSDVENELQKVISIFDSERSEDVLPAVNDFIERFPDNMQAYYLRGIAHLYITGNFNLAIKDFDHCLFNVPDFDDGYLYRGITYRASGESMQAIKDFSKSISLNPENDDAFFMRALIKSDSGDNLGAINDYDEILRIGNNARHDLYTLPTVYNNKAYCLVKLGRIDEAMPLVNKALEMEQSLGYIWDTRGEIYYKINDYENCISDMSKAIELDKEAANSFYYRGLSYIKLGKKVQGCSDLSKSGELGNKDAFEAISKYCN